MDAATIFGEALEKSDDGSRARFLDAACGDNAALRAEVLGLLEAHEGAGQFLVPQENPALAATQFPCPLTEKAGDQIGPYKLLQQIGEGGFGTVYMAEQTQPIRRKVALKVIKPGMDTREVIARFEAERQALALMDHPNIAKVLDGGTTESGRPYFVMELVKGIRITQFCDENKLDVKRRLKLFCAVCRAIQHAHQKGVIHRDIKPNNVLVTLHDGEPVPKVIDFGVAKAISQQLTEKTMFTAYGQMIGTPQYMSPEQAEMSGLDIDTRSDIYSLGVLLYELLTGFTPLAPEKIRSTTYVELQRLICEEEPLQPSRRYSTQGEQSATIAAQRQTEPRKLGSLLRGELDWIVMKTIEKDRNRRYDSPSALEIDIENFLNDETVTACPPSIVYRFRKFARRNKTLLLTGGTIGVSLLVSTLISISWYIEARDAAIAARNAERDATVERDRAKAALDDNSDLRRQQTIEIAFSLAASNQQDQARHAIDHAQIGKENKIALRAMLDAEIESNQGDPAEAVRILKGLCQDLESPEKDVILQAMLAHAYFDAGDYWSYFRRPVVQGGLVPKTPYEKLFVGKTVFWLDFKRSISLLNEAVALTPSPLSFTYRARSLALQASSIRALNPKESLALIDQAVEDADTAMRLFRARGADSEREVKSPARHCINLLVLLHAYDIYKLRGRNQKAEEVLEKAAIQFEAMSQADAPDLQYVLSWKGFYRKRKAAQLDEQGEHEQASEEKKQARQLLANTSYADWLSVAELLRIDPREEQRVQAKRREALRIATAQKESHRQNFVIALLHLLNDDTEAGRNHVNRLLDRLKQKPNIGLGEVFQVCQSYLLMGQIDNCREYASRQLSNEELVRDLPVAQVVLKYFAGEIDDEEYLNRGKNGGATTSRFFILGTMELAKGNRDEALRRFQQVEREGLFHAWQYELASAFAARMEMERDRGNSWPDWLPSESPTRSACR
jgi:serine/threonine protein kinase